MFCLEYLFCVKWVQLIWFCSVHIFFSFFLVTVIHVWNKTVQGIRAKCKMQEAELVEDSISSMSQQEQSKKLEDGQPSKDSAEQTKNINESEQIQTQRNRRKHTEKEGKWQETTVLLLWLIRVTLTQFLVVFYGQKNREILLVSLLLTLFPHARSWRCF